MEEPYQEQPWHADVLRQVSTLLPGKLEQATEVALDAISRGMRHPLLLHLFAARLERQGRYGDALRALDQALGMEPSDVFVLNAIASNLLQQRSPAQALKVIDRALQIRPAFPQGRFTKGRVLRSLDDREGARQCFIAAARSPGYADPVAALASLEAEAGDFDAAARLAHEAIKIDPSQSLAAIVLCQAELGARDWQAAEQRLLDVLKMPTLIEEDRAAVLAMLGEALEAQGRYGDAFKAYLEGKADEERLYAPQYALPGKETHCELVRRLAQEFSGTTSEDWRDFTADEEQDEPTPHIFLMGFPRSGTTLLEQALSSHSQMDTLNERSALIDSEIAFLAPSTGLAELARLDAASAQGWRAAYWRRVGEFGVRSGRKAFLDKLPLNSVKLPLIAKLFPTSKVVFAFRDPRDVVLSCVSHSFAMNSSMYELTSLRRAAAYYDAVMGLAHIYRDKLPVQVLDVRHEDVVRDFDSSLQRICDFVGIEWEDAMRDFSNRTDGRTPSVAQLRGGLSTRGIGRWRHYRKQLGPIMPILEPWVTRLGYEPA